MYTMTIVGMAGGFCTPRTLKESERRPGNSRTIAPQSEHLDKDEGRLANTEQQHPEELHCEHQQLENCVDDEKRSRESARMHHTLQDEAIMLFLLLVLYISRIIYYSFNFFLYFMGY